MANKNFSGHGRGNYLSSSFKRMNKIILYYRYYSRRTVPWSAAPLGLCTGWTPSRTAAPPGPGRPAWIAVLGTGRTTARLPGSLWYWGARTCAPSTVSKTWPARWTTTSTCSRPCTGNSRSAGWPTTGPSARPVAPPAGHVSKTFFYRARELEWLSKCSFAYGRGWKENANGGKKY